MRKILPVLMILLVPALVLGQAETTGRITGNTMDEDGQPIAGALISVQSPVLMGERQTRTNERGEFLFALLPVGPYRVTISAPGKKTMDFTFQLNLGKTVPLNVTMEAGQDIVEEVTVFGTATRFETTAGGENFNLDTTVEELPIQQRDLESLAFNAPNMANGPNTTPRIAGANAFDTVVLLDGAEISDPLFGGGTQVYIEDAIEELQVLTSGVSARYGRFQGGVLNAITKTGGNEFTGSLRVEYDNDDWNSATPFGEELTDDVNYTALATAGGYVLRDRLWWFAAGWYEPDTARTLVAATGQSQPNPREEERWQYKVRGAINPDHVIDISYLEHEVLSSNRGGLPAGDLRGLTGTRRDPQELWTASYQGVLSASMFLDLMYTSKEAAIESGGDPAFGMPIMDWANFRVYHSSWWDQTDADVRNNQTYNGNLTYTFTTDTYGSHTIEGGLSFIESETGGENRQSPTGFNLLAWVGDLVVRDESGTPIVHPDGEVHFNLYPGQGFQRRWDALTLGGNQYIDYTAAYLQDSWEYGDWRLDLGVRWESYSGDGPLHTNLVDYNSFSPRLGVTYNLNQDWQIQASYGHYQGRFNDNYAQAASGVGNGPLIERADYIGPALYDVDGDTIEAAALNTDNWARVSAFDSPEFPVTILADDLESGYARDVNLSIKRALPNNSGSVELRYTNRDFKNLVDDFYGGDYQEIVDVVYEGTNFGSFDQTVWDNAREAVREYQSITMVFDYRPSVTWNVGGNWTWSQLRGNYTGEFTNQPAAGSQIGDYPNSTPQANANPSGNLPGDIEHRVRAWANYRFDFGRAGGLTLGALGRFQTGLPWTRVDNVNRWIDDPEAIQDIGSAFNYYFEPRGANRYPSFWAVDFSARYQLQVWKDLQAWLKVNVLNVLDLDSLRTYKSTGDAVFEDPNNPDVPTGWVPQSGFGEAEDDLDYQFPRTYLITVGASWK